MLTYLFDRVPFLGVGCQTKNCFGPSNRISGTNSLGNSLQLFAEQIHLNCRIIEGNNTEDLDMSEFEAEVKKAEQELEQSLIPVGLSADKVTDDEFLGDLKMQAQEYGQKIQDAAIKAKDFANDKFAQAGDKFKELSNKDPKELVEDVKEFARQKPGQTILISAAIGLIVGLILKGGRRS